MKLISTFITFLIVISSANLFSQVTTEDFNKMHNETPDDAYLPQNPAKVKKTPAYKYRGSYYTTTQVNVDFNGLNILFDAANEPSIAVDPNNPDRIAIGWRQFDNIVSNFRQAGYGYSIDGGQTWTVPEPIDPGVFRSDPVLDTDEEGNFYYNSLTKDDNSNYWCDVYRTSDDDFSWDEGTFAYGGDKQWMIIDKTGGSGDGNIYEFWNSSFSSCAPGSYTRSTDGGDTYDDCDGVMGDPIWGTLTVGSEGQLYTVGAAADKIVVTRASNAYNSSVQTSWDFSTYVDLKGNLGGWRPVNPSGLLGQAWIATDNSEGPGKDNVYVLSTVARNDIDDQADVMFARSTDGGENWEETIRVNDDIDIDHNNWQWFGTMSVAPNGRIDAVWLDTRNAPGTNEFISELFYSYSIDQGETWSSNECISEPFNPKIGYPNQNKMGDYFHMISDDDIVHVAWANTFTGGQDVYYTRIYPWYVGIDKSPEKEFNFINYPNPFTNITTLRFAMEESEFVTIELFDIMGNKVKEIISEQKSPGIYNQSINFSELPSGVYYAKLTVGTKSKILKLSCIK